MTDFLRNKKCEACHLNLGDLKISRNCNAVVIPLARSQRPRIKCIWMWDKLKYASIVSLSWQPLCVGVKHVSAKHHAFPFWSTNCIVLTNWPRNQTYKKYINTTLPKLIAVSVLVQVEIRAGPKAEVKLYCQFLANCFCIRTEIIFSNTFNIITTVLRHTYVKQRCTNKIWKHFGFETDITT